MRLGRHRSGTDRIGRPAISRLHVLVQIPQLEFNRHQMLAGGGGIRGFLELAFRKGAAAFIELVVLPLRISRLRP